MESMQVAYCSKCRQNVAYHFDSVNHGKQLLLTVFTLGLWLPIWLSVALRPTKICDECGEPIWALSE